MQNLGDLLREKGFVSQDRQAEEKEELNLLIRQQQLDTGIEPPKPKDTIATPELTAVTTIQQHS